MALQNQSVVMKARPFVKWAGGKGGLCAQYEALGMFPSRYGRYFEPFAGGGAVFFHLRPERALLSDSNEELMNAYRVVRERVEELIAQLVAHKRAHSKEYFYKVRRQNPEVMSDIDRAARFIYLNKTCYNGLYRVNRKGQFNVPYGDYTDAAVLDPDNLRAASRALQGVELRTGDFEECLTGAAKGDLVYLDPPYQPISKTSSFTGYTPGPFGVEEQQRLARVFRDLSERGCLVMESNSHAGLVKELYKGFHITAVKAPRAINCKGDGRGKITEFVITNYPPRQSKLVA